MTWQIYVPDERKSAPATLGQEPRLVKMVWATFLASSAEVERRNENEAGGENPVRLAVSELRAQLS
jgi:hypothetical protein